MGARKGGLMIAAFCAASSCTRARTPREPGATVTRQPAIEAGALDTLVIDNRTVHFRLLGATGPSVILVSGLGDGLKPWEDVQPAIAQFARVLSYDRFGIGRSSPGAAPRTVSRMTDELHALIPRTGLSSPYILVGHSLGGFIVQLYAARYPSEVAGLVLVDPSVAQFYVDADSFPAWRLAREEQAKQLAKAPPAIQAEASMLDQDVAEMLQAPALRPIATVLLTSTHRDAPASQLPLGALWVNEHRRWAREHPGTRQIVDSLHGHYLQREAPALVIDAVRSIATESLRARRR